MTAPGGSPRPVVSAVELAHAFSPSRPRVPTDAQRRIVEAPLVPAAVVAGAGSGKTETMATRVVWLVANGLVAPDRVLGLTFTRKAAAELAERVRVRLAAWRASAGGGAELPAGEPTVSTYAAYAGRLVAEHAVRLGEEPAARLLSAAAGWQAARDVVARWDGPVPEGFGTPATVVDRVLQLAGRLADHLVHPADVLAVDDGLLALLESLPPGPRTRSDWPGDSGKLRRTARLRAAYLPLVERFAAAKRAERARDFGDEMVLAARLAAVPAVAAVERERFGAVLLDEYQDTGHAQVTMLRRLFGDGHPVTAVGDPLQSIYGWRGASAGTMSGFATAFGSPDVGPATVYPLATSWRNDWAVLDVANTVAAPLRGSGSEPLGARPGAGGGTVRARHAATVLDEATWVAAALREAWDALPPDGPRTAAVLVRRRAQIAVLEQALREADLPVEVVDLGGLLSVPEVADVHATLQVVADHTAGTALMRLLTGARWRLGVHDLQALQRRARELLDRTPGDAGDAVEPPGGGSAAATGAGTLPTDPAAVGVDATADPLSDRTHLVEALDDLGHPGRYSEQGRLRLVALRDELRRLRARAAAPLPELVADVEHTLGLDVEVAARPATAARPDRGRAHLDRFLAEVTRFSDEVERATLPGFLAFLAAAEQEENGLGAGEVAVDADRVQVLTVHGAKGLEWDVVAVPGLVDRAFPATKVDDDWVLAPAHLPDPVRGDRDHIPRLDVTGAASRKDVGGAFSAYHARLQAVRVQEERRLAYVAFTRARSALLLSGYRWSTNKTPYDPSPFLVEARALDGVAVDGWVEPGDVPDNPLVGRATQEPWPVDPLGARRPDVEAGAALVRAAAAAATTATATTVTTVTTATAATAVTAVTGAGPAGAVDAPSDADGDHAGSTGGSGGTAPPSERARAWARDADLLLAEQARERAGVPVEVPLPAQLSVSALVTLQRDPQALARSLRRRLPSPPNRRARRGTAFHGWLEQRWAPQAQVLLDVDELPGAADESVTEAGAANLAALQAAFERSAWARRVPHAVEVPFEMVLGGRVVRGRMDAVFAEPSAPVGHTAGVGSAGPRDAPRWVVVDWKTGPPPTGAALEAAAVQLAAYRLAWAALAGVPVTAVDAAFHHVPADLTLRPAALLDAEGLRRLVSGPPGDGVDSSACDPGVPGTVVSAAHTAAVGT